jgi:hypothetical protein
MRIGVVVIGLFVWLIMYGLYNQYENVREERRYLGSFFNNRSTSAVESHSTEQSLKPLTFYKTLPEKETKP